MPNRLEAETSPYLLQHADNPVDWYPWSDEAFALARERGVPVLLSIGYSACHWCHVMAHESFEDEATAAVMNKLFVNIKVDREERPDVDKIYQTAHQLLTQRPGGWPLTMFLSPYDQRPAAGTLGQELLRRLIDLVDVWPLFPVHFHVDEQLVHQRGRGLVLEGLVRHDVAPVAGRVANRQQHRHAALARQRKRLVGPGVPVHGILGMLQQIWAGFGVETVRHRGLLKGAATIAQRPRPRW